MKHTDSLSSASLVKCTVFVPCFSNSSPFLGLPTISNRQQSFKKFPGRAGEGGSRVISEFWPMNVLASSVHVFPITLLLSPFPPPIPHTHTQEESNERDRERLRPRERQRDTERDRERDMERVSPGLQNQLFYLKSIIVMFFWDYYVRSLISR